MVTHLMASLMASAKAPPPSPYLRPRRPRPRRPPADLLFGKHPRLLTMHLVEHTDLKH